MLERYGLTETLMNSSNPYDGERRAGTVGFALPGVEIRLGDGRRDPRARTQRVRRLLGTARGDAWRSFDADGWFATGDIGAFDDDGYLSIVGRSKELIISGGYNVYPREVEDVLRAYPGVADVRRGRHAVGRVGRGRHRGGRGRRRARRRRVARVRGRASSRRSSDRVRCASSTSCRATRSARSSATSSESRLRRRRPTRAPRRAVRSTRPRRPARTRAGAR